MASLCSASPRRKLASANCTSSAVVSHKACPASNGPYTVRRCVNEYLDWLDRNRKSAKDARYRAEALILPELGDITAAELTAAALRKWRDELADNAPRLRTRKDRPQNHREVDDSDDEAKRRRKATANRTLTILKAALNAAWREGKIPSDDAWRRVEPFEEKPMQRKSGISGSTNASA